MYLENKYQVTAYFEKGTVESFYFSDKEEATKFARYLASSGLIKNADIFYNLESVKVYNSAVDALESYKLRQSVKGA